MNLEDAKFYAINSTGLGVAFTDIDITIKILVGIVTLTYGIGKLLEQIKEHKHNALKRQAENVQIKQKLKEADTRD
jgi:hypothetical protein